MDVSCDTLTEILSDRELVFLVQSGNTVAFTALADRYMAFLHKQAGRYANTIGADIEDFVQEGMLALFRAAKGYNPEAKNLFSTYAITCINNSMTDVIRSHAKNTRQSSHLRIDDLDERGLSFHLSSHTLDNPVEDTYLNREASHLRAWQIENLLSNFEQQVLKLYLRGYTYQQISSVLSTATKAVDNALQRVRRKLRPEI